MVALPSGRLHPKQPHHSRDTFVIDGKFPPQLDVSIGLVSLPGFIDEGFELLIFSNLLSLSVNVLATNAQGGSDDGFAT